MATAAVVETYGENECYRPRHNNPEGFNNIDSGRENLHTLITNTLSSWGPRQRNIRQPRQRAFKIGMLCVDQYVDTCVSVEGRFVINSNVADARRAYASLCDDRNFQTEYLQHAPCYRNVSSDWKKCSKRYLEQDRSGQSDKLCCAQSAFLDCVYEAGNDHCRPEATRFLREMANQLFKNTCHPSSYSAALCASGRYIQPKFIHIVIITSILAFIGRCVNV